MANAVFNSMENYFKSINNNPNINRNAFSLSNIRTMDCDFGILYPFYLEDCLPADDFKISNTIRVQALPMFNPLFNNLTVRTWYFYVPYPLLWHKFELFMQGGRDGTYTVTPPFIARDSVPAALRANGLYDYMGFQPLTSQQETLGSRYISAFPFAAYQRIYRDFFMSQDDQTSTNINAWFPEDDLDFQLHDGFNYCLGMSSSDDTKSEGSDLNNPTLLALRYKNYSKDYFTSAWFSPQRGPLQTVPVSSKQFEVTSALSYAITDDFKNMFLEDATHAITGNIFQGDFAISRNSGTPSVPGKIAPNASINQAQSNFTTSGRTALINKIDDFFKNFFDKGNVTSTSEVLFQGVDFSVNDLRFAVQLQGFLEKNMSIKPRYKDFLRVHFGDSFQDDRFSQPYFIGGSIQNISVSEVLQTSESNTTPQGNPAGHASSFNDDFIGSFHSHEYGLILGILCIMPDVYYNTGIDRHWTKQSKFDYFFPEFGDMPPQDIHNYELFADYLTNNSDDDAAFGYIGYGDEYRHHRSMAVGSFRNPSTADFKSWVLTRDFSSHPSLNSNSFISSGKSLGAWTSPQKSDPSDPTSTDYDSTISHDIWATGFSQNPFIVQVGINCRAVRPLPYVPDPSKIL